MNKPQVPQLPEQVYQPNNSKLIQSFSVDRARERSVAYIYISDLQCQSRIDDIYSPFGDLSRREFKAFNAN